MDRGLTVLITLRCTTRGFAPGLDFPSVFQRLWSACALLTGTYGLFAQQPGLTATSLYGLH